MSLSRCSFPLAFGAALLSWGVAVLVSALASLGLTSSFFTVHPFGAPLWTGTLGVLLGCFMLVVFHPQHQLPVARSKAEAIFAVVAAVAALAETLLATGLSAWLLVSVGPSLSHCSREPASISQCKCSTDFVDPPSLVRHIQLYEAVDDCGGLGTRLLTLYYLLTALYCVGVVLSITTVATAGKQLHSVGMCGKSGIYTVTPQPPSTASRQPSFSSTHTSIYATHRQLTSLGDTPHPSPPLHHRLHHHPPSHPSPSLLHRVHPHPSQPHPSHPII